MNYFVSGDRDLAVECLVRPGRPGRCVPTRHDRPAEGSAMHVHMHVACRWCIDGCVVSHVHVA